jgi:hypothetical protein
LLDSADADSHAQFVPLERVSPDAVGQVCASRPLAHSRFTVP